MQFNSKIFTAIATLVVSTSAVYADGPSSDLELAGEEIEMKSKRFQNRPKAPSMQKITCVYLDGWISIEFEFDEGMADMQVIDLATGFGSSQSFSTAAPAKRYVGLLSAPTLLIVTPAAGQTYEGYIY